jgi:hypothetical protein
MLREGKVGLNGSGRRSISLLSKILVQKNPPAGGKYRAPAGSRSHLREKSVF